jgi:hypothetical protein
LKLAEVFAGRPTLVGKIVNTGSLVGKIVNTGSIITTARLVLDAKPAEIEFVPYTVVQKS